MRRSSIAAALLGCTMAAVSAAHAQCPTAAADGCQKAVDLLNFMTPQLGTAIVGGNPTLGQGGALGGFGHFSIDVRASAVNGQLPQFNNAGLSINGAQHSSFTSKQQYVPFPSFDVGIGLWRGYSLGVTHIGGLDALVTATYMPSSYSSGSGSGSTTFAVTGGNPHLGFGLRLGILEESVITPGVSVAWVQRDLPTLSATSTIDASGANPGGSISLDAFSVNTTAWRVTASKSFLIFGLSGGLGQDHYTANSTVMATVNTAGSPTGQVSANLAMTRMNYFVGLYMNLFIFKLEGEYGQVTGGHVPAAFNTFGADPATSRSYFTLGLRFGR